MTNSQIYYLESILENISRISKTSMPFPKINIENY